MTDDNAKEDLKDYYDAVDTLSEVQANLACSTKVLEEKIEDKTVVLDIIRQIQLQAVQISIRTVEEEEKLKNMTYRDVTLRTHLPDFRRLNPNATEYEQITGLQALQMGCTTEFRCQTAPFKRLVTGKKQRGRGQATKFRRSIEDVAAMGGGTPAKRTRSTTKATPKPPSGRGRGKGRGKTS